MAQFRLVVESSSIASTRELYIYVATQKILEDLQATSVTILQSPAPAYTCPQHRIGIHPSRLQHLSPLLIACVVFGVLGYIT